MGAGAAGPVRLNQWRTGLIIERRQQLRLSALLTSPKTNAFSNENPVRLNQWRTGLIIERR